MSLDSFSILHYKPLVCGLLISATLGAYLYVSYPSIQFANQNECQINSGWTVCKDASNAALGDTVLAAFIIAGIALWSQVNLKFDFDDHWWELQGELLDQERKEQA